MLLTVQIPYVYSETTCMPDTFRKVRDPTEIINPGHGRQITQYHMKWFFLVNSLSFFYTSDKYVYALYSCTQTMPNFSPKGRTQILDNF